MATVGNEIKQKLSKIYCCEICDYITERKSNFDNHVLSAKHQSATISNSYQPKLSKCYCCEKCDKTYKDRTGLWRHKKLCTQQFSNVHDDFNHNNETNKVIDVDTIDKDQLILMLIKQNADLIKDTSEFKNMMMEVIKNGTHNTTHMNSHNKTFNLQLFLNETCKDAMNIMDFVDSIKLQLSDLESVGQLGYVEGISKIIVSNLNLLDETKRPVHCADSKREVMYVKDDNKWEKESAEKSKLRNAIKCVTRKNTKLLKDFRLQYPGCDKSDSKLSTKYDKLTLEAFGGKGDDNEGKEDKIIRNIAKNVIIDKVNYIE
jgi:hypothetical protein